MYSGPKLEQEEPDLSLGLIAWRLKMPGMALLWLASLWPRAVEAKRPQRAKKTCITDGPRRNVIATEKEIYKSCETDRQ